MPDTVKSAAPRFGRIGFVLALALLVNASFVAPAYAYVDPSVMTYTIQALAGVAVAIGAVAGVAFRRTRKAIFKLLKIDENAHREVEPPVRRCESDGFGFVDDAQEQVFRASAADPAAAPASQKRRVLMSALASVFFVFTLFVAAPLEICLSNRSELTIGPAYFIPTIALSAAIIAIVLAAMLSLLRGRAHTAAIATVFGLGICCYVQAMFMNSGLPLADGSWFDLSQHIPITVISLIVWLAILTAAIVLSCKKRRTAHNVLAIVAVALLFVQAVGVGSLLAENDAPPHPNDIAAITSRQVDWYVTEDGLFEVGSKNNVIVFVLDTFDEAYLEKILEDDPSALDGFTGFTHYRNCSAALIPTRYGVPFLLTGESPRPDEKFSNYLLHRYERSDFLPSIARAGYSIGLYSDTLQFEKTANKETCDDLAAATINLHDVDIDSILNVPRTLRVLYRISLYRDAPWLLKGPFQVYTATINSEMIDRAPRGQESTFYTVDDAGYYKKLKAQGLTVDDRGYDGTFRFIHLNGSHTPYSYDGNMEYVGFWWSDCYAQSRGTLRIVERYLDELKELGLYEDATIIVTADHGEWWFRDTPLEYPTSSIMLVKQSGQSVGVPVLSHAPVQHADFQETVLDAMGIPYDDVGGGDGMPVSQVSNSPRTRYCYATLTNTVFDIGIVQWSIDGNVRDLKDWKETGVRWDFPNPSDGSF